MAYQTLKNKLKAKPLRLIFIFYWFLLAYILAALVFWYITLNRQNQEIYKFRLKAIGTEVSSNLQQREKIEAFKERKTDQYIGEGITFLLLIFAGAIIILRLVRWQLVQSQQQKNFMMAITHELKTPIAVTKLNLETMQIRKLEPDQKRKLIQNTIQETNRLDALCNNILLTSQIDSGGYTVNNEKFDLGILVNDCVEDFIKRFPSRKIEIDVKDEAIITGDKILLQLSINNLLDNALKYSGKDNVVLVKVFQNNKKIFLQVIDEGTGVALSEKEKIFDKYFRGRHTRAKGTGLGLYLTKEIVRQHHGSITMKNNIPYGAVFEIQFKTSKI